MRQQELIIYREVEERELLEDMVWLMENRSLTPPVPGKDGESLL